MIGTGLSDYEAFIMDEALAHRLAGVDEAANEKEREGEMLAKLPRLGD
jgi:hypothetical protein